MSNRSETPFTSIQDVGLDTLMQRFRSRKSNVHDPSETAVGGRVHVIRMEDDSANLFLSQSYYSDSIHFDLSYTPLPHLGSKWVTAATSRLLAAGVTPKKLWVTLAVPNMISVEMLESILEGMDSHITKVPILVNEVNPSRAHLSVSIVSVGSATRNDSGFRNRMVAGDALCVTGDVGSAMAGLRILLREKRYWEPEKGSSFTPNLAGYEHVVGKQLLPPCRVDFIEAIQNSGVNVGGMIDLSQGLMNDLQLMAGDLECGFELHSPALPIDLTTRKVADEMKEDVDRYALYGGEDYEFLFTIPDGEVEKLRASFEDFSVIGEVTTKRGEIVVNDGERGSV